jgi:hypothetical protein
MLRVRRAAAHHHAPAAGEIDGDIEILGEGRGNEGDCQQACNQIFAHWEVLLRFDLEDHELSSTLAGSPGLNTIKAKGAKSGFPIPFGYGLLAFEEHLSNPRG